MYQIIKLSYKLNETEEILLSANVKLRKICYEVEAIKVVFQVLISRDFFLLPPHSKPLPLYSNEVQARQAQHNGIAATGERRRRRPRKVPPPPTPQINHPFAISTLRPDIPVLNMYTLYSMRQAHI